MPKQIRKLWKQLSSSKHVVGAITIFVLMLMMSFASMLIIIVPPAKAAPSDYLYHKKITINHLLVNQTLGGFPVWVYNTSADFVSNILTNGSDMAFYDSTNATQFPHEIEVWNKTTGELGVWVNVSSVSSATDTIIYMYYGFPSKPSDKNYNPTNVWEKNYTAVWHMNDTVGNTDFIWDSTANGWHGTKTGANKPTGVNGTGGVGGAQNFTVGAAGNITINNPGGFNISYWTVESSIKNVNTGAARSHQIFESFNGPGVDEIVSSTVNGLGIVIAAYYNAPADYAREGTTDIGSGVWKCIASQRDYSSNMYVLVDGIYEFGALSAPSTSEASSTQKATIGIGLVAGSKNMEGEISELRVSDSVRNSSWVNSSYRTMSSPSTFLTFGNQETAGAAASSYSLKFNMGTRIDWAGTSGTTVWSNSSGTYTETMEINLTVNSSDNVTDVRVWVGNMNDTGVWVNASNITLLISSDNSSYGSLGAFTDGGSNISINTSTWVPGTMGTSPFTLGGVTNANRSIYCRFKLAIPSTATTNYYFNYTNWRVYIGHFV